MFTMNTNPATIANTNIHLAISIAAIINKISATNAANALIKLIRMAVHLYQIGNRPYIRIPCR